jgi:hypothetical protein
MQAPKLANQIRKRIVEPIRIRQAFAFPVVASHFGLWRVPKSILSFRIALICPAKNNASSYIGLNKRNIEVPKYPCNLFPPSFDAEFRVFWSNFDTSLSIHVVSHGFPNLLPWLVKIMTLGPFKSQAQVG